MNVKSYKPLFFKVLNGRNSNLISGLIILAFFIFHSYYLIDITLKYSVNILFWDQWDFYIVYFNNLSYYEYFILQHGPHRQGIGPFFTEIINYFSDWDTKVESLSITVILILSCFSALWLKFRVTEKLHIFDFIIVYLFLSPVHIDTIAGTPNLSHSALPLLLFILYCHIWLFNKSYTRNLIILCLNLFLTFTGFGVFTCLLTLGIFSLELLRSKLNKSKSFISDILFLSGAIFTILFFLHNYRFNPAVDCFGEKQIEISSYIKFCGLLFSRALSITYYEGPVKNLIAQNTGIGIFLLLITTSIISLFSILRHMSDKTVNQKSLVVLLLCSFVILYAINISIGRICLTEAGSQVSRYSTLLMLGFFGFYISIILMKKRIIKYLGLTLLISILSYGYKNAFIKADQIGNENKSRKEVWKICYLKYENINDCDIRTGTQIYPNPQKTGLENKLKFLKENKLNLYKNSSD